MNYKEIMPFVQILVNHGCLERKVILKHMQKIGFTNVKPSTISRCFLEFQKNTEISLGLKNNSIRKKKKELINLEINILKIIDFRKIIPAGQYVQKIFERFVQIEQNPKINKETIKILVVFAKKGKKAWNSFFDNIDDTIDMKGNLSSRSSYLELKRYVDRNKPGDVTLTLVDIKKALMYLESFHWQLFSYYRSLRKSILIVERKYLNRSEVVSYLTDTVNEKGILPFGREYKPYHIKNQLENMDSKKLIIFPRSYTFYSKKEVRRIYIQSQKLTRQALLVQEEEGDLNGKKLKKPVLQLLNRIFTTHLHEFYRFSPRKGLFFQWWHRYGKSIINDLQHDLLTNGSKSETFIKLEKIKKLRRDRKNYFKEVQSFFDITELQLQIFQREQTAESFFFTLINFLAKYFLGANHFRLKKGEYGFIPLYTRKDVQKRFDSYAEGIHIATFRTIEFLRVKHLVEVNRVSRQKKIFMDINLGEIMEACIVKNLLNQTAPKTMAHKVGEMVIAEMESNNVTGKKAILVILVAIKKSVFFTGFQEALNYLRDLITSTSLDDRLDNEIKQNWITKDSFNHSSVDDSEKKRNVQFLKENIVQSIDDLVQLGHELLFNTGKTPLDGSRE